MSFGYFLASLLTTGINLIIFIIFVQVVLFWLVAFEVLKVKTPQAENLVQGLNRITDRLYRPIQKYIPPIGGIDITPIVVILGLQIVNEIIWGILT